MTKWQESPVDCAPREAGFDETRLAVLERHFGSRIEDGKIQGASYLLARNGKVFAHKAAGRRTPAPDSDPLRTDHIKTIASISKVFTATAIMKLVEDGVLWLDQSVKTILKEFDTPMHGDIRLCHLLTHTSGLPADGGFFGDPYPINRWEKMKRKDWIRKAVLTGLVPFKPGEQWAYSSISYCVLAEIVSRVSGVHYNEFVQERIFRPLGMERSFLEPPESLWPEICYTGKWQDKWMRSTHERKGAPNGGGGVFSTLHDLFKFGQCFLNGGEYAGTRILGPKTAREMMRNQLSGVYAYHWGRNIRDMRHGLGWGHYCDGSTVGPATVNHEGYGWCALYVDPAEQFIYVNFIAYDGDWVPDFVVSPRTIAFSGVL
jgi:CubicO group peptidase (beta-lactamase class C family)